MVQEELVLARFMYLWVALPTEHSPQPLHVQFLQDQVVVDMDLVGPQAILLEHHLLLVMLEQKVQAITIQEHSLFLMEAKHFIYTMLDIC